METYDSKLFSLFVQRIEAAKTENRARAVSQYADMNFYHAAVAREIALGNCLTWLSEIKKELDTQ